MLGSDRRPNMPNWRTDVMMIIAIDESTDQVGVISLPRDIYVDYIPGHRGNKINVIDYLGEQDEPDGGGPKLMGQVLEEKIGVRIDHYIRFDFEAFKQLVDAMGGVEVEVDCPLYDPYGYDQGGLPLALDAGVHRLNGGQALSYVRSRRIGGDLERERRQQRLAWAVRTQILDENLLPRVPAIYAALNDSIQTDIGLIDALESCAFRPRHGQRKRTRFCRQRPEHDQSRLCRADVGMVSELEQYCGGGPGSFRHAAAAGDQHERRGDQVPLSARVEQSNTLNNGCGSHRRTLDSQDRRKVVETNIRNGSITPFGPPICRMACFCCYNALLRFFILSPGDFCRAISRYTRCPSKDDTNAR